MSRQVTSILLPCLWNGLISPLFWCCFWGSFLRKYVNKPTWGQMLFPQLHLVKWVPVRLYLIQIQQWERYPAHTWRKWGGEGDEDKASLEGIHQVRVRLIFRRMYTNSRDIHSYTAKGQVIQIQMELVLSSFRTHNINQSQRKRAAEKPLFSREHMQLFKRASECGRVIHMCRVKCVLRLSPK